jgi:hypothetical protein
MHIVCEFAKEEVQDPTFANPLTSVYLLNDKTNKNKQISDYRTSESMKLAHWLLVNYSNWKS